MVERGGDFVRIRRLWGADGDGVDEDRYGIYGTSMYAYMAPRMNN